MRHVCIFPDIILLQRPAENPIRRTVYSHYRAIRSFVFSGADPSEHATSGRPPATIPSFGAHDHLLHGGNNPGLVGRRVC